MTNPLSRGSKKETKMSIRTTIRRGVIAAGVTALALGPLTACTGGGDSSTEITMWTFLDPAGDSGREQVLGELIASYEKENPGVSVKVEVQQWDTMTQQFLAADVSGSAPDIIWAALDQVSNAVDQGALADLNALAFDDLPDDQLEGLKDVYWNTMEQADGSIYGVVQSRNYFGIMYRTDILAAAGIDPADIRTWDDLTEAAQTLTDSDNNTWGLGQAFGTSFADPQILAAHMMETEGAMFGDDGTPLWNTDSGVRAMDFQKSLITDGATSADAVRLTAEDLYELFSAGQVAMINAASARVPTMQTQVGAENVGFMHYPSEDGETPAPGNLAGWSVGVWSGSDVAEQAADFVAYMASPEADAKWMLDAQQPPMYESTADENADFLADPSNSFLAVVLEGTQQYGWLPPTDVTTAGWREALNEAVQSVLLGEASSSDALDAAVESFGSGAND